MQATILAKIAIRIVAIYLVTQGVLNATGLASVFTSPFSKEVTTGQLSIVLLIHFLVPLLFGLFLWLLSNKLASLIVGNSNVDLSTTINTRQLQSIALSSVGLVVIFTTLPDLVNLLMTTFSSSNKVDDVTIISPGAIAHLVGLSLKVLFGLLLIFGARFWSGLLHSLKGFGLYEKPKQ